MFHIVRQSGSTVLATALIAALGWLASPGAARAETEAVIGNGTAASCTSNAASNAFTNAVQAGGTVTFNCGQNPVTIVVNTSVVDKTVTVSGAGRVTLDGENLRQIFFVQGTGNLTLNGIALGNGDAGDGGAIQILAGGKVTINRHYRH